MRADGNNVDVDVESANLAKNQLLFDTVMAIETKRLHTLSADHGGPLMGFFGALDISASGLTAERLRMDMIANNLANANTQGRGRQAVPAPGRRARRARRAGRRHRAAASRRSADSSRQRSRWRRQALAIAERQDPGKKVYDPGNPDANRKGYVTMPNVNPVTEMIDLITATRAYEANTTAIKAVKGMAQHAMDVLR